MDDRALADILIRHAVGSEKFSAGLADKIVRLLNSADQDLVDKLAGRYAAIAANGYDRGPAQTKRLEDLLDGLRAINAGIYQRICQTIEADLVDVAAHETQFAQSAAAKAGVDTGNTLPSAAFLKSLVTNTPITGLLLSSWVDGLDQARMERLEQAIRNSAFQGESTDQIVARIRGTKAMAYKDGILNISRKSAQTFALTANATVQNTARLEVFRTMKSIGYVEFSAVLDSRTTPLCQSLSGQIWSIDSAHPIPPLHNRCRSILLPRRNDTDAPLHTPYPEWLKGQSLKVQNEVMGQKRAELFRSGKVTKENLFRVDGSYRTLAELQEDDANILK